MSGQQNWRTPRDLFRAADAEFHFTIDVAADHDNHLCRRYMVAPSLRYDPLTAERLRATGYTDGSGPPECVAVNALSVSPRQMAGERMFANIPFANPAPWIDWFSACSREGATVFGILHLSTPRWFGRLWATASELRLTTDRVTYIHPPGCECKACAKGEQGTADRDSMFAVWRPGLTDHTGFQLVPPRVFLWNYPRDSKEEPPADPTPARKRRQPKEKDSA